MEKRPLTDRGRMTHICVSKLSHHWFRYWLVASCLREPLSEPMLAYYLFDPREYNAMHQSTKNKAGLRDLISATGLVILLKFDPNNRFSARVTLKFDG